MKKGAIGILAILILILIGTIFAGIIFYNTLFATKQSVVDKSCAISIAKASMAGEKTIGMISQDINCPVVEEELTKKEYMRGNVINDNKLKQKIADELVQCFDKTGQGTLNPFRQFASSDATCLICSKLIIDKDLRQEAERTKYEIKGMNYFLASRTLPKTDTTYLKYFTGNTLSEQQLAQLATMENRDVIKITDLEGDALLIVWRVQGGGTNFFSSALSGVGDVNLGILKFPSANLVIPPVTIMRLFITGSESIATGQAIFSVYGVSREDMLYKQIRPEDDIRFCDILAN